jgi:hypothetical protein
MTPFSLSQPESSMEELLMIHTKEMLFLQQGIRGYVKNMAIFCIEITA